MSNFLNPLSNILRTKRNLPSMRTKKPKPGNVTLVPHPYNRSSDPGRTIIPYSEYLRHGEQRGPNYLRGEHVVPRDGVTDEQIRAAREWQWHVDAGRIGPKTRTS